MTPSVILLRHGRTAFNSTGVGEKIRGHLDIPLTKDGKSECREVSQELVGYDISRVISSDLDRASCMAEIIAKDHDLSHHISFSRDLRPWNLGALQGKSVKTVVPKLDVLLEHPDRPAPAGESFNTFKSRYLTKLRAVLDEAERNPAQGVIVLVAHTRNLMLTRAWMKEGMQDSHDVDMDVMRDFDNQVPTGSGYVLTLGKRGWVEKAL